MDFKTIFKKHGIELSTDFEEALRTDYKASLAKTVPVTTLNKKVAQLHKLEEDYTLLMADMDALKTAAKETNVDEITAKNVELSGKLFDYKKESWDVMNEKLSSDKNKDKFEKIKEDFIIKAKGEEYSLEDIEKNIAEFKRYDKIDYFSTTDKKYNEQKPGANKQKGTYFDPYAKNLGNSIKE